MNSKVLFALRNHFLPDALGLPAVSFARRPPLRSHRHSPLPERIPQASKILLQAAVVGLGFGMNLQEVIKAGKSGFVYTAISITFAMLLGTLLGKLA